MFLDISFTEGLAHFVLLFVKAALFLSKYFYQMIIINVQHLKTDKSVP